MKQDITYVGLDVHKDSIYAMALLPQGKREEWHSGHNAQTIKRLIRKLEKMAPAGIVCCYEAGPCGYDLQRKLETNRIQCVVVAPSLIPKKPGERIKTDRRDARKLAELLRADLLTEVVPPTPAEEAVRDLVRARDDAKDDEKAARHRIQKFLLRRGVSFTEGKNWTHKHYAWLRRMRFERSSEQAVFDNYLLAVEQTKERVKALDEKIEAVAQEAPYARPVAWLRCFRGFDTLTAMVVVAELHCFQRFQHPRQLMAYLGLVPGEHSSSENPKRRGITKTGNAHVRRILIEAAWHARHPVRTSYKLRKRREGQPASVVSTAERAQARLNRKYWKLAAKKKHPNKICCAVAREMVGFIWAVLYEESFIVDESEELRMSA